MSINMRIHTTHESAATQFVEADGVRFAFRRIGAATGPPIVFCHRFRGTMDAWDMPSSNFVFRCLSQAALFRSRFLRLAAGAAPIRRFVSIGCRRPNPALAQNGGTPGTRDAPAPGRMGTILVNQFGPGKFIPTSAPPMAFSSVRR
jgi:hypothetical protein